MHGSLLPRQFPNRRKNICLPIRTVMLAGNTGISVILFQSAGSLVNLAGSTVVEISEYGKLLLPVMTAALAGQGGVGSSAAIYAGTAFFHALLTSVIGKILTPMVYLLVLLVHPFWKL